MSHEQDKTPRTRQTFREDMKKFEKAQKDREALERGPEKPTVINPAKGIPLTTGPQPKPEGAVRRMASDYTKPPVSAQPPTLEEELGLVEPPPQAEVENIAPPDELPPK